MEAAVAAWGERAISELEAEDRLAFACEKAPTEDPVTAQVRVTGDKRLSFGRLAIYVDICRPRCTISCAAGCLAL